MTQRETFSQGMPAPSIPEAGEFDRSPGRLFYLKDFSPLENRKNWKDETAYRPFNIGDENDRQSMMNSRHLTMTEEIREALRDLLPLCESMAEENQCTLVVQEGNEPYFVNIEFYGSSLFLANDLDEGFLQTLMAHAAVLAVSPHHRGVKLQVGLPCFE